MPSFQFFDESINYSSNLLNENGHHVSEDFEYSSNNNNHFLTVDEIIEYDNYAEL